MNNNSTLDRMKELKLWGMYHYLEASLKTREHEHTTADELLAFLIEAEYDYKRTRRINAALHRAGFRYPSSIEEISFGKNRNLDKNSFMRLADCSFVEKKEDIIVTGSTGVGKSKLVSALGHQACIKGYSVRYFNMSKLFSILNMAKADNSYLKEMTRLAKLDVLILDDWGLHSFDQTTCMCLLEIIEDRHGRASTIIASQVSVKKWHELLGEQTLADAMLDRILHTSHKFELQGDSMRKQQKEK